MARQHQRDLNLAMGLAQLAALVVLFWVLFPSGRDLLKSQVLILVGAVVLVLVVSVIILLACSAARPPRSSSSLATFTTTHDRLQRETFESTSTPAKTSPELTTEALMKQRRVSD